MEEPWTEMELWLEEWGFGRVRKTSELPLTTQAEVSTWPGISGRDKDEAG